MLNTRPLKIDLETINFAKILIPAYTAATVCPVAGP